MATVPPTHRPAQPGLRAPRAPVAVPQAPVLHAQAPVAQAPVVDRHYEAVLCAEVRRLARELRTSGPLSEATLAHRCHAGRWGQGDFQAAVRAGIRAGALRQRPFDFIDVSRHLPSR
ncbi:MAG TPA: hypothetical protein VL972_06480 [Solirubrobacteraceae bacterium]|nr:hypothetical protein [Solirubrobacteraceae bacterium]